MGAAPQLVYERTGSLYVAVHGLMPPSDADWDRYLQEVERTASQTHGYVVYSAGAAPSSEQRRRLYEVWRRVVRPPPVAVVSSAPAARMAAKGYNLLSDHPLRMLLPHDLEDAFVWAQATCGEMARGMVLLDELVGFMGVPGPRGQPSPARYG